MKRALRSRNCDVVAKRGANFSVGPTWGVFVSRRRCHKKLRRLDSQCEAVDIGFCELVRSGGDMYGAGL